MRRRIDVDETLAPVAVPGRILNELYGHALETLPEECCGLLLGGEDPRFRTLVRCRNVMTQHHQQDPAHYPRDGRQAFWMSEADYQRAEQQAEAAGERVTAVYHSHVGAGAYLSALDLEYAENALFPFPDADQIVVAVAHRKIDAVGLFRRAAGAFAGHTVVSGQP